MREHFDKCRSVLGLSVLLGLLQADAALGVPVAHTRTESNIDWTSAGVAGVGGGSGTIQLTGVSGTVTKAFLYWHGIDNSGPGSVYDNANVTINGHAVTGAPLGDATTNCWGEGSSRAYRADVTPWVPGNGAYLIGNLSLPGHSANGASLVVIFDDGINSNNRDLVFFEGNDSNIPDGFPGEDTGWHATLAPIAYSGGTVRAQFHLADGQFFEDNSVTFSGDSPVTLAEATNRWDGDSLPSAGTSRTSTGDLWDIHTFNISGVFTTAGTKTLQMDGQLPVSDCLGLALLLIDLAPGSAPPADDDPPLCPITANRTGPPAQVEVTFQDTGSGLANLVLVRNDNASVPIPPFTVGTNDPVVVTATKINQSLRARVEIHAFDVAGNMAICDPILTLESRLQGKPVTQTITDVPRIEDAVTITNGTPGLKNLDVTVNGTRFKVTGLGDGEERTLDISSAMVEGPNTIELETFGKPGGWASIMIWDGGN